MKNKITNKTKAIVKIGLIMLIGTFFFVCFSHAAVNRQMNYQGKLTNLSDVAVPDGNYDMVLKIYDGSDTLLWTGTYTAANGNAVAVANGIFSVMLGSGAGNTLNLNFEADNYYLGVKVGSDAEMTPKKRLGAVPQAINSLNVIGDGFVDIDNTSAAQDAANINYNPTTGTNSALSVVYGSSGGTGTALKVTQAGTGYAATFMGGNVGIGTTSPGEKLTIAGGNISLTTSNSIITGATGLTLQETGDTYGTVKLHLQNRTGVNGAMFEQAGSVDLVDFVFKSLSNQRNIRFEDRAGFTFSGTSGNPEFQIGTAGNPTLAIGDSASVFRLGNVGIGTTAPGNKLTISGGVGIGTTAAGSVYLSTAAPDGGLIVEGNVGIGKTNPQYALDVTTIRATTSSYFYGNMYLPVSKAVFYDDAELGFGGAGGTQDVSMGWNNADDTLRIVSGTDLSIAANTWMALKSGNVGIGTTNPQRALHIGDGVLRIDRSSDSAALLMRRTGTNTKEFFFGVSASGANNGFFQIADYGAAEEVGPYNRFVVNNSGDIGLGSTGANSISSNLANATMVVLGSGNVGIGTTNPLNKLHIAGTGGGAAGIYLNDATPSSTTTTLYNASGNLYWGTTNLTGGGALPSGTTGQTLFNNAGSWTATSNLFNNGTNVGIGTTLPSQLFQVNNSGATAFVVTSGGSVGIGTTSPLSTLHVSGSIRASGGYVLSSQGYINNNALADGLFNIVANQGPQITRNQSDAYPALIVQQQNAGATGDILQLKNNTTTVLTVQQGGNVGIGTTNPGGVFHAVSGTTYATTALFERPGQTTDSLFNTFRLLTTKTTNMGDGFGTGFAFNIQDDAGVVNSIGDFGAVRAGGDTTGDLVFRPAVAGTSTERMRITSGGLVGIGTSNPNFSLDIGGYGTPTAIGSGSIVYPLAIATNSDGSANIEMVNTNAGANADFRFSVLDNVKQNALSFVMPSSGFTSTLFGSPRNTSGYIFINNLGAGTPRNLTLGVVTVNDLIFGTNNAENMRIKSGGNIGIGTSLPSQLFQVNNSGSTAFVVTSGGNVGIGTTSPTDLLHVYPTSSGGITISGSYSYPRLTIANSVASGTVGFTGSNQIFQVYSGTVLINSASEGSLSLGGPGGNNSLLVFNSSGTNFDSGKMYIKASDGNVGIGTTSPGNLLTVVGGQSGYMTFDNASYGGGGSPQLKLLTGASSGATAGAYMTLQGKLESWVDVVATNNTSGQRWMRFGNGQPADTFSVQLLNDAADAIISTPFSIKNNAPTGSFYINSSGYVGIGTTAPTASVHLFKADSSALTDVLVNSTTKTSGNMMELQVNGASRFKVDFWGSTFINGSLQPTNANSSLIIGSATASSVAQDHVLVQDGGLRSTSGNTSGLRVSPNFGNNTANMSGNYYGLYITPIYNQGAGSAGNNTDLLINRTETALASGVQYLIDAGVGGGSYVSKFNVTNSGQGYFAGNVGIGTTDPLNKLHVAGTGGGAAGIYLNDATPSSTTTTLYNASGNLYWGATNLTGGGALPSGSTGQTLWNNAGSWTATDNLFNNGTNVGIGTTLPSQLFQVNNSGSTAFVVTSGGNVGIGMTSPGAYKLNVAGDTYIDGGLTLKGNILPSSNDIFDLGDDTHRWRDIFLGGETLHIGTSTSDEGAISYITGNNVLNFQSTGDIALQSTGGNVGIGTTAPTDKLDIAGGVKIGAGYAGIGTTAPANGMLVQGNVGIGTTSPTANLAIAGDGTATNAALKVTSGYADLQAGLKISNSLISNDLLLHLPFQWSIASTRGNLDLFLRTDTTSASTSTYTSDSGWMTHANINTNVPRFERTNMGHGVWMENTRKNMFQYQSFENAGTPPTGWTTSNLETSNTVQTYRKHQSYSATFGDTNSTGGQAYRAHTLVNGQTFPFYCYAMNTTAGEIGTAVDSSVVELYNGAAISTTYTPAEGGWYKISGNVTGTGGSVNYGVDVKANKQIQLDACQIEADSSNNGVPYATTMIYNDGTNQRVRGTVEETLSYYVWRGNQGYEGSDYLIDPAKGTVSFWFRPEWAASEPASDLYLLEVPNVVRIFFQASDDKVYSQMYNGADWTTVSVASAAQTFNANTDHFISFRWDNTAGAVLNLDGTETSYVGSWTSQLQQITTSTQLYVGSKSTAGGRADALISDFAVFGRNLAGYEVAQIFYNKTPIEDYSRSDMVMLQQTNRSFQVGNIRITGEVYGSSLNTSGTLTAATVNTTYLSSAYTGFSNAANYSSHIVMHLPFQNTIDGSRKEIGTFTRPDSSPPAATAIDETTLKFANKGADEPRIDRGYAANNVNYDTTNNTGNPGIYMEESRKNVLPYSSFEDGSPPTGWNVQSGCSASQSSAKAMHGSTSANVTTSGLCRYTQSIDFTGKAVKHQISAYVFRNETNAWGGTVDATIAGLYAAADLNAAALATTYTPLGNGWYRMTAEFTPGSANWYVGIRMPSTGRNVYVDAVQVERTDADGEVLFPTTYIPTTTTENTRAAEKLYYPLPASFKSEKGGVSFWFKPDWSRNIAGDTTDKILFAIPNIVRVRLDATSNDYLVIEHYNGSSWVATATTGTNNINQYAWNHFTCGWYYNYNYCRVNNGAVASGTSWTPQNSAGKNVYIGSDESGNYIANAQIAAFTFFDTYLTPEQQSQIYNTRSKFDDYYRTDIARLLDSSSGTIQSGGMFVNGSLRSGIGTDLLPGLAFSSDTNTGLFSPVGDTLAFSLGGSEKLRISSSGNLGIGTTAPGNKLTVSGGMGIGTTAPGSLFLSTAAPDGGMIIEGSVGIGTTNPGNFKLQVAGNAGPNADDTYDLGSPENRWRDLYLGPSSLNIYNQANAIDYDAVTLGYDSNVATLRSAKGGSGTSRDLQFLVGTGSVPAIYLNSSNNVGIGMTTPGSKLSVLGGVSIGSNYAADSAPADGLIIEGNVGIGDNSPNVKFKVNGGVIFSGSTANVEGELVYDNGSQVYKYHNGTDWQSLGSGTVSYSGTLWTQNGSIIYYTDGNVGIGTTNPLSALDVKASSGDLLHLSNGSSQVLTVAASGNVGIGTTTPGSALGVNGGVAIGSSASFYNAAAPSGGMVIEGNVGIGTTSPDSKMLIKGTTSDSSASALNVMDSSSNPILFVRNDSRVGIGTTSPSEALEVTGNIKASGEILGKVKQMIKDFTVDSGKSVTAGDVVTFVNGKIQKGAATTFDAEAVFNPGNSSYVSAAKLDSTHFVFTYQDSSNSNYSTAVVGTVSGTTISFGSEYVFFSASSSYPSVSALDSTHFVVCFQEGSNGYGSAYIGTVSGSTISYGSKYTFNSGYTYQINASTLDSTHFVVGYQDGSSSSYGTAVVGTVSGSTISYGSEYVFNPGSTSYVSISTSDSTHFVVGFNDGSSSGNGTAVVGTVSGSTISYGSEYVFNPGYTYYNSTSFLDSTHFVIAYRDDGNSYFGTAVVGTVSGSTISYGSEYVFNSGSTAYTNTSILDSTHFVVAYQDGSNSSYGTAVVGTVSGSTISFGSKGAFNSANTSYTNAVAIDSTNFVASFRDDGNGSFGTAVVGTVGGYDQANFAGIAKESCSADESCPVFIGGVADGLSSLTSGSAYYANLDGSLTTTKTGYRVGLAISSTEIMLSSNRSNDTQYFGDMIFANNFRITEGWNYPQSLIFKNQLGRDIMSLNELGDLSVSGKLSVADLTVGGKALSEILNQVSDNSVEISEQQAAIVGINLKTSQNIETVQGLQTSVNENLALIGSTLNEQSQGLALGEANSRVLGARIEELKTQLTIVETKLQQQENNLATFEASTTDLLSIMMETENMLTERILSYEDRIKILEDRMATITVTGGEIPSNVVTTDMDGNAKLAGIFEAKGIVAGSVDTKEATVTNLDAQKSSSNESESNLYSVKVSDVENATLGESQIAKVETDENLDGLDDLSGSDGKSIMIETAAVKESSQVFVTAKTMTDQPLVVTEVIPGQGFKVALKSPADESIRFSWWVVDKK